VNGPDRIEEALRKMEPGAVPPHLIARLTAARPQPRSAGGYSRWRGVFFRWLLPVAASACVAVGTFSWLEHSRRAEEPGDPIPAAVAENRSVPVESQDFLLAARPVGIVVAPNQRPYRIMDVEWLEYETVRSTSGGPAIHTATKRRDVVPVALELY
jgi:hypothetical protein